MDAVVLLLIQLPPFSIPLWVVILALVGVLLLAMILGGLLVLRLPALVRSLARPVPEPGRDRGQRELPVHASQAQAERADPRASAVRPVSAESFPRQNVVLNALSSGAAGLSISWAGPFVDWNVIVPLPLAPKRRPPVAPTLLLMVTVPTVTADPAVLLTCTL